MFRRVTAANLMRTPMGGSFAAAAPHTMNVWSRFASSGTPASVVAPTWTAAATTSSPLQMKTKEMTPLISQSQLCHFSNGPTRVSLARIGNSRSDVQPNAGGSSFSPTSYFGGGNTQGNDDPMPPHVRKHLIRVYNLLAISIGVSAVGSGLMIFTALGKMVPFWAPMVLGFVPLLWLNFKPPASSQARTALLLSFALIEGMALAPVVKMSAAAGVLGSALVLTGAVFGGFSAASFLAPRASLIALQGPMFGMLMGMMAVSLLNMIYPTAFAHSLILYGGLALFSVFVAVDTQAMIERARCGVSDPAQDALGMFLNVINIFVRIAQILRSMGE